MKSWLVNIKIWLSQWIRRVDWYIIKKFLGTYFFAIALIISIAVVFDVNENIDKFINNKAPMEAIIFDYYLNFIPYFSNLFSPLFVFIAVEKDPPYAVNILQADELLIRRGYNLYRSLMDTYHECKMSGNWYGYLGKNNQINTLALPSWLAREVE